MPDFTLKQFCVRNLNGLHSLNLIIKDNRLILVGENGAGKSTLLTMVYYTLSRQWEKLIEFDFGKCQASCRLK